MFSYCLIVSFYYQLMGTEGPALYSNSSHSSDKINQSPLHSWKEDEEEIRDKNDKKTVKWGSTTDCSFYLQE